MMRTLTMMALAGVIVVSAALAGADGYAPARKIGTITSPSLAEVSGLTPAHTPSGGWWVLNDSGNPPDLSLIDGQGQLVSTVRVPSARNVDWEDLAARHAHGRWFLYVGDIGDNHLDRDDLVVYRVLEPGRSDRQTAAPTAFPFRYPDGHHNAEALFVDPTSGGIFVVTKAEPGPAGGTMYAFPAKLVPNRRVTLERVQGAIARELRQFSLITGAAISPDGLRFAVRTYTDAFEWRRSSRNAQFAIRPQRVVLPSERKGESIAYTTDGRALVVTSEQLPAPLWRLAATR